MQENKRCGFDPWVRKIPWSRAWYPSSTFAWTMTMDSESWRPTLHYVAKETHMTSLQSLSHVRLFATPWTALCKASLSITKTQSLLKLMSIESVMPSNHLILCCPLLLLPSVFPSIRVFSNESVLGIRWPKY